MPARLPARILVGIDGSPQSLAACRYAAELAARFGSSLLAVQVAPPFLPPSSFERDRELARQAVETARMYEHLAANVRRAVPAGTNVEVELHFGFPAETLCRRARELAVDLIVLGSRGLGMIGSLLLGSVSTAVARDAFCSVLIVRETGEATSERDESLPAP